MPLEAPNLDTRTFDQIYREALLRIPRYTPEWTDFNDGDPGITLLQLFAWLTEMTLFGLNQVPERNYIKFLQLLNLELQPAHPAEAHVTITATTTGVADSLPPGTQFEAQAADGGDPLIFETEAGLDLVRPKLMQVHVYNDARLRDYTEENNRQGATFAPFGWTPQVNSALYLGFEPIDPAPPGRLFPQMMSLRVFYPTDERAGEPQRCEGAAQQSVDSPGVRLVWEYKPSSNSRRWQRMAAYKDETNSFTREGYILLEGPSDIVATQELGLDAPYYWVRCRLDTGSYGERVPVIDFVRPNTTKVTNLTTVREEVLGSSDGSPDQTFRLRFTPVQVDTLSLETEEVGADGLPRIQPWTRVEDLLSSSPDALHFTLNATRGEVTFGNGINGQIPPAGAQIIARLYRYGGGKRGNVQAGTIIAPVNPPQGIESVINERPAVDGRDEEDVDTLRAQAPKRIRARQRAVTAEDYAALAREVGGVKRATAIALAHPAHPGVKVPGAVTVVIVPDTDTMPPEPSADLIDFVCRELERYRLLTTEVYVKGPTYTAIKVEATVQARSGAAFGAVANAVKLEINRLLDPVGRRSQTMMEANRAPQTPWAFGQDLYPTGLYSTIMRVDDVVAVDHLAILVNGLPHELDERVSIAPDGLVYGVEDHDITVLPQQDS